MKSAIHSFNLLYSILFHFFRCYKVTFFRQLVLFLFLLSEMNIFQREIDIIRKPFNREVANNCVWAANNEVHDWQKVLRQWNKYHSKYNTCKRQEKTIFWFYLIFIFAPERRIPKIQKRVGNVKK